MEVTIEIKNHRAEEIKHMVIVQPPPKKINIQLINSSYLVHLHGCLGYFGLFKFPYIF